MKRRLLASILSFVMVLSLMPITAMADGEDDVTPQEPAVDVTMNNPYFNDGITIDGVTVSDGLATVKVSYAKANQMAGIAYSYTLDGEEVTDRAIAQQIDGDGIPQTDKNNINGYLRDCTVYTFPVEEGGTDITVTVDGSTFWDYDAETKTLTISGEGSMADFTYMTISDAEETVDEQCLASFPWAEYKNEVENVIVKDDITRIGNQAFRKFFALKNLTVESKELLEIGNTVCMNNSALKVVDLTACTKLAKIGSGMLTYVTNDAAITVKMAAPVAGLWRGGDNYLKANTIFTYDKDGTVIVDNWECLISGSECEIVAYKGSATEVVIPASIVYDDKTYKVALIDGGLFQNNTEITSVAFAEGSQITALPDSFMSCADLRPSGHGNAKSVILPSGIETIGASAFAMYSQNLTTFQIGNDATCIDLTKIKSIGTFGLANLSTNHISALKEIVFPKMLKKIGNNAFYFSALEEFPALPDGLTTIGAQAFYNSRSAKTDLLVIPATVTEIGNQAFRWCGNGKIKNVQVNSEALNLGRQAFLLTSGTGGYIDLSAVKNLTMVEGAYNDGLTRFGGASVIYVADDSIAAMMNDEVNYPKTFDKTTTSIISVNGGTVSENPTGLSSVTRKDGNTTYTAVWYEDGEEMTNPTTNLKAGSTYSVKWVAAIDGGYQVAAIADQTYTGAEIEPAVVVTDSEGNVLEDGYTVTYTDNVDVGTATAKVTIGSKLVEVSFNILKDMNPTVTMGGGSVTYGDDYELKPSAATSTGSTIDGKIVIKCYTDAECTEELKGFPLRLACTTPRLRWRELQITHPLLLSRLRSRF